MNHKIEAISRVRELARKQVDDLNGFDYTAPAELFPSRSKKCRNQFTYKRFDTAAEAIQHAIEQIPVAQRGGSVLEVGEERYEGAGIQTLYASTEYPLARSDPSVS